jgi:hypothetical protein
MFLKIPVNYKVSLIGILRQGSKMSEPNYKYKCSKCKTPYTSLVPLKFCVCGSLLVPLTPDPIEALKDLFGKNCPFPVEMFKS